MFFPPINSFCSVASLIGSFLGHNKGARLLGRLLAKQIAFSVSLRAVVFLVLLVLTLLFFGRLRTLLLRRTVIRARLRTIVWRSCLRAIVPLRLLLGLLLL